MVRARRVLIILALAVIAWLLLSATWAEWAVVGIVLLVSVAVFFATSGSRARRAAAAG